LIAIEGCRPLKEPLVAIGEYLIGDRWGKGDYQLQASLLRVVDKLSILAALRRLDGREELRHFADSSEPGRIS
jgi:hypothetical protein